MLIQNVLAQLTQMFPSYTFEFAELEQAAKSGVSIEIKPILIDRSREQENYYRKWCREFAFYCGMTEGEMHEHLLIECFGSDRVVTKLGVRERPRARSSDLDVQQYSVLIDKLIFTAGSMGYTVPPPEHQIGRRP